MFVVLLMIEIVLLRPPALAPAPILSLCTRSYHTGGLTSFCNAYVLDNAVSDTQGAGCMRYVKLRSAGGKLGTL